MKTKSLNGNLNIVGLNIKKYRELNHISQRELERQLSLYGIDLYHSDISKIENLQLFVRDYELKIICKILNITVEQLFENTDHFFDI